MKTGFKLAACLGLTLLITACGEEEKAEAPEAAKTEMAKAETSKQDMTIAEAAEQMKKDAMTVVEKAEEVAAVVSEQAQTMAQTATQEAETAAASLTEQATDAKNEMATAMTQMAQKATEAVNETVAAVTADAANGEKVFKKCKSCHTVEEGGKNKVGPNLFGIIGKAAGSVEGYKYSKDFASMGVTWSEEDIYGYIKDPTGFLREKSGVSNAKSKMTFKLKKEQDRRDVAAYLAILK